MLPCALFSRCAACCSFTPALQALLLVGRASLEVQSGEVATFGCTFTAASGCVEVCADERCGGALVLEPGASLGTVPLAASSTAVFTLGRAPGKSSPGVGPPGTPLTRQSTQQQQQQQAQHRDGDAAEASTAGVHLGFEAWLASDPSAPVAGVAPLPPLWQQAAGEVEDSMAQQAQQGGGPPLIVVCGAKKVGKSTFARFLVNSLLGKHACVAYLDTGASGGVGWGGAKVGRVQEVLGVQYPSWSSCCCCRRLRAARVHGSRPCVAQPGAAAGARPATHAPAAPGRSLLRRGHLPCQRPRAVPAVHSGTVQMVLPARSSSGGGRPAGAAAPAAAAGCQHARLGEGHGV